MPVNLSFAGFKKCADVFGEEPRCISREHQSALPSFCACTNHGRLQSHFIVVRMHISAVHKRCPVFLNENFPDHSWLSFELLIRFVFVCKLFLANCHSFKQLLFFFFFFHCTHYRFPHPLPIFVCFDARFQPFFVQDRSVITL